jgi:hypothetical protein
VYNENRARLREKRENARNVDARDEKNYMYRAVRSRAQPASAARPRSSNAAIASRRASLSAFALDSVSRTKRTGAIRFPDFGATRTVTQ